jgi:ABC-type polysaccharide/polyol phosphate export permease
MAFMFSFILGSGEIAGKPFIIFLLSGIVVYNIFSRTVMLSANSLIGNMSVIKQIYFPREIVLLTLFGEVLLDFAFSFIALLIINTLFSVFPNYYYLLLPFPLIIMSILSLGVSFFVSFWSLRIRDLRQIISIVLRLLFYITVLFTLRIATPEIEIFGVVNPLTVLVEFFRTVILYESAPDFALLVWPTSLALVFAYSGYVFYKSNEGRIVYYS